MCCLIFFRNFLSGHYLFVHLLQSPGLSPHDDEGVEPKPEAIIAIWPQLLRWLRSLDLSVLWNGNNGRTGEDSYHVL